MKTKKRQTGILYFRSLVCVRDVYRDDLLGQIGQLCLQGRRGRRNKVKSIGQTLSVVRKSPWPTRSYGKTPYTRLPGRRMFITAHQLRCHL